MSEENNKARTVHNIVYSVKGGCGKTSFSLFLTLSNLFIEGMKFDLGNIVKGESGELIRDDHIVSNYMLDMDFLGTILMDTVGIDDDANLLTMSDIIFDGHKIRDMKELNRAGRGSVEKYIIYSSYCEREKEKFHVKRENTPLLRYDDFRYEIRDIQKEIELYARSKPGKMEQLNIIYDMPPNSDGYTDAFLNEMVEVAGRESKGGAGQKVVLYLLFNSASTLHCNIEWLKRFICSRNPEGIEYVFVNCSSYLREDGRVGISADTVKELLKGTEIELLEFYFYDFAYSENISLFNDDSSGVKETKHLLEDFFKGYDGENVFEGHRPPMRG